jgi:hypothetical protein
MHPDAITSAPQRVADDYSVPSNYLKIKHLLEEMMSYAAIIIEIEAIMIVA